MADKVALITGATGQDGAHLVRLILSKGCVVHGIKLCQAYRKQHGCDFASAMPTNLYGLGDKWDLEHFSTI